jgi:hypothetical protein
MSQRAARRREASGKPSRERLMEQILAAEDEPHPGPMHHWESEVCYRLRPNPDNATVDQIPGLRQSVEREAPPPFDLPADLDGQRAAVYEAAIRAVWHRREGRAGLAEAWQERWAALLRLLNPTAPGCDFTAAYLSWPEGSEQRKREWELCRRLTAEPERTPHD